jgi:hypothetical protein
MGWYSVFAVALIAIMLLGIEEIGIQVREYTFSILVLRVNREGGNKREENKRGLDGANILHQITLYRPFSPPLSSLSLYHFHKYLYRSRSPTPSSPWRTSATSSPRTSASCTTSSPTTARCSGGRPSCRYVLVLLSFSLWRLSLAELRGDVVQKRDVRKEKS